MEQVFTMKYNNTLYKFNKCIHMQKRIYSIKIYNYFLIKYLMKSHTFGHGLHIRIQCNESIRKCIFIHFLVL